MNANQGRLLSLLEPFLYEYQAMTGSNMLMNDLTAKARIAARHLAGVDDAVKAGYTNLGTVTDDTKALLGNETFPEKSSGFYLNGTSLTTAIA